MALRIIIRTDDASMASNVGGAVLSEFKTFIVDLPEVESFLRGPPIRPRQTRYDHRQIIGVELVEGDGAAVSRPTIGGE